MGQNIGERQRWAWMAAALSGVAAAELCSFSWLWVLLGGLLATAYQVWLDRQIGANGLSGMLTETFGVVGKILALITALWTVLVMGWTAVLADKAFPMVDGFPSLGWVLLALAAWGSWKGAAACARCSGVLCLFLIVLYGIIAVFSVPDVQTENVRVTGDWTDGVWTMGLFLLPAGVWFVSGSKAQKGPMWKMMLLLPLSAAVLSAVTAGVLTQELASAEAIPLYDLAQSVSLFGVIERIEPLLSAAMTMGVFSLLSTLACASQALLDQIRPWPWSGAAACAAGAAAMYVVRNLTVELLTAGAWIFWVAIPLLTVLIRKLKADARTNNYG